MLIIQDISLKSHSKDMIVKVPFQGYGSGHLSNQYIFFKYLDFIACICAGVPRVIVETFLSIYDLQEES